MSETPSWPYTGSAPANDTLGDVLSRSRDVQTQRLLEGFSGYLVAYGTHEEQEVFDTYFFGGTLDSTPSESLINEIEAKFQTFFWGAALDKSATTVGDPRTQAKATFQGGIEVSREVRYWNDDLTKYTEGHSRQELDANGEKPQLGFDRAYGSDGNFGTIVGVDGTGRPVIAQDTEETRIGFKATYEASSPQVSGLIAKFPKLKDAVAYSAVGRKRVKEFRTDSAVRKQLKDAMLVTKSRLIGEKYSMKGASSLVAKAVEDTMKVTDNIAGALIDAVDRTADGVRYTVDLEEASYTKGVTDFLGFLKSSGWKNTQFKNFWAKPSPTGYRGVNTKWEVTVDGQSESVEVQFHTKESYDAKEDRTHKLKEEIRLLGNQLAEAAKRLVAATDRGLNTLEYGEASEQVTKLKLEIEEREKAQLAVFEDMAKEHTPKDATTIALV